MIQANELRIGNYVMCHSQIESVKVIDGLRGTIYFGGIGTTEADEIDIEFIEPIPLTEELLLKCGLVKHEETKYEGRVNEVLFDLPNHGLKLIKSRNKDYFFSFIVRHESYLYDNVNFKIEHLHELQNFHYALYRKELEIKL